MKDFVLPQGCESNAGQTKTEVTDEFEAMLMDDDLFTFPGELRESALRALMRRPKRATKIASTPAKRVHLPLFDFDEEV